MGGQRRKKRANRGRSTNEERHGKPITAAIAQSPSEKSIAIEQTKTSADREVGAQQNASDTQSIYRLEVWQHRFTFALVVATMVQAAFAIWQWKAMLAQNELMLRQIKQTDDTLQIMRHDQIADIYIGNPTIDNLASDKRINLKIPLTNAGGRTGVINHLGYELLVSDLGHDIPDEISKLAFHSVILGQTHLEVFKERTRDFFADMQSPPAAAIKAINESSKVLRLLVSLDFRDALGDTKMTWRSFLYDPGSKRFMVEERYYNDQWIENPNKSPYQSNHDGLDSEVPLQTR